MGYTITNIWVDPKMGMLGDTQPDFVGKNHGDITNNDENLFTKTHQSVYPESATD